MTETFALPEILGRRVVHRGYLTVTTLLVRPRDGAIVSRDVEYHGNAAAVLPYNPVRRCGQVARLFRGPVFDTTGERQLEEACAGTGACDDSRFGSAYNHAQSANPGGELRDAGLFHS